MYGLMACVLTFTAQAQHLSPQKPAWSFEVKAGRFTPNLDNWERYYGSERAEYYAGAVAYKILRNVEVGIEGGWVNDKGVGSLPVNQATGGSVKFEMFPLHVFALIRGVFSENQWLVPYIGGGWTRLYYREQVADQDDNRRGAVEGSHLRGGVQFLLDRLDSQAAASAQARRGLDNSYLYLEMQQIDAQEEATDIDLGGEALFVGLLLEF